MKLDSALLNKIINTPISDLEVSPSACGFLSGFVTGRLDINPPEENMKLCLHLVRAILFVGHEWGKLSTINEIENTGKNT